MGPDDGRGVGVGVGEDRLSAMMAVALVAANLAGGGLLAVLKMLGVPPLVAITEGPRQASVARRDPGRPEPDSARPIRAAEAPDVARLSPADRDRRRR